MYIWPEGLERLAAYLRKRQVDIHAFKTARQAAWIAQKLLKTRIKFQEDLYMTLREIQKAVPEKDTDALSTPHNRNGTANREMSSSAAPAPSAAKRSKRGKHVARVDKVNQVPDTSFGVHIFCDGACEPNPGSGGWGVVVYRDGLEVAALSGGLGETTNNVMEMTGMLEAVQWLIDHFLKDQAATIWCDSQYVVNGCNIWRHNWKKNGWSRKGPAATKPETGVVKNLELWQAIDEALNKCSELTVAWVKGHVGIEGNERADELSVIGRRKAMETAASEGCPQTLPSDAPSLVAGAA